MTGWLSNRVNHSRMGTNPAANSALYALVPVNAVTDFAFPMNCPGRAPLDTMTTADAVFSDCEHYFPLEKSNFDVPPLPILYNICCVFVDFSFVIWKNF